LLHALQPYLEKIEFDCKEKKKTSQNALRLTRSIAVGILVFSMSKLESSTHECTR